MKIFGQIAELTKTVFRISTKTVTIQPSAQTGDPTINIPNLGDSASHDMVLADTAQTLTNKTIDSSNSITLKDSTAQVVDATDATKKILFNAAGNTSTSTTLLSSQTANQVLTLPDATDTLVARTTSETLSNKTLDSSNSITLKDSTAQVVDASDATKRILFDAAGSASTATTIQGSQTANRTLTLPDATDTLVARNTIETLTNKKLSDSTTSVVDVSDPTIAIKFDAAGSTGTSTTLLGSQTTNRTLTLPDATDTLTANSASQNLTNKNLASSTNTLTGATAASFANSGTITLPTGTRTLVARDTTDTLTNKDIDGGTASDSSRITLPKAAKSTLDGLTRKEATLVYGTDTGKAYVDDGSQLKEIGSGSSGINYLSSHFGADALGTVDTSLGDTLSSSTRSNPTRWGTSHTSSIITQSTNGTLRGTTNYLVAYTANAQFIESPLFTLDGSDLGRPMLVQFDVSGVGTSDDVQCYVVRYNSSNVLQERILVAGTASATTPFSARVPTGTTQFRGFFIPGSTASDKYAVRWLRNASNTSMRLDSFVVGPQSITLSTVPPTSQVKVYTGNGFGSSGTRIRRFTNTSAIVGTDITYADSATAGASFTINRDGVYTITWTDKTGVSDNIGISKNASSLTTDIRSLAESERLAVNVLSNALSGVGSVSVTARLSAGDVIRPHTSDGALNGVDAVTQFIITCDSYTGSNVTLADRAVEEYAWNSDATSTASVTASGFSNGPAGVLISSNWSSAGTTYTRRIRFQQPIQSTDRMFVEINNNTVTNSWQPAENIIGPYVRQSSNDYGIKLLPVSGSATDVDVQFQPGGPKPDSTYGANGTTWSGYSAFQWRVRKVSGGAAVGYPVSSANVVGRLPTTSGADLQPSGYIGQIISDISTSAPAFTASTYTQIRTITLTAGIWRVMGTVTASNGGTSGYLSAIVSTSATGAEGFDNTDTGGGAIGHGFAQMTIAASPTANVNVNSERMYSVAAGSTTTLYLVGYCTCSSGSWSGRSKLIAVRIA